MTSALRQVDQRVDAATKATTTVAEANDDDYADIGPMCDGWRQTSDEVHRRRLRRRAIVRCLPLADHIAYRFVARAESTDDRVQVARLGLIKAIDGYDPGSGPFLGYAVRTIMGDVRRHFRDHTGTVHVPRTVKDLHQRVRAAMGPLGQRLGRTPTASELATELGVDRDYIVESVQAMYGCRPKSLDVAVPGSESNQPSSARHGAVHARFSSVEDAMTVAASRCQLTERERLILRLRFCENLPQSQIGRHLGVSQVQVSRLLAATLQRLRQDFREDPPPPQRTDEPVR